MDTSESEDCFESADEDFLSDDEDTSTENQESQIEAKVKQGGPKDTSLKADNQELDLNKNAEKGGKDRSGFAPIPARVECWEVESDDGKLDNVKTKRPEFGIPPARVDCWEPGVNEPENLTRKLNTKDVIKTEGNKEKFVDSVKDVQKDTNVQCNKTPSLFQDQSEINVSSEGKHAVKQCQLPLKQGEKASQSSQFIQSEKKSLVNENFESKGKEMIQSLEKAEEKLAEVIEGIEKVSLDAESRLESCRSDKTLEESMDKDEENMWDDGNDDWVSWNEKPDQKHLTPTNNSEKCLLKKRENDLQEKVSQKKEEKAKSEVVTNDDMWGDDEDWGDFDKSPKKDKDDLWGEDEGWGEDVKVETPKKTENITKALENLTVDSDSSSWSGWGNWGIGSVLSTAANLTSTVSQGLTTVIGVPDPEELARQHKAEKEKLKDLVVEEEIGHDKQDLGFGLGNLVNISKITKLVESTSTKVISGGLDTLETIGKKTMEVLQENDPGLKKKRAFLKIDQNRPVLSQILREAKEKAEEENKELEKLHFAKKANYEMIFDDYQGLVHLEALEMLSRQCDIKLQTLLKKSTEQTDLQETLDQVKELCELPEEDDEETLTIDEIKDKIEEALTDLNIPITYGKLLSTWEDNEVWIGEIDFDLVMETEVHQQAIETLAQLTAICVEQYHKAGELLLIKEHRSTADEADSLSQLTSILSTLISLTASKFSEILDKYSKKAQNKEEINSLITNIFLEAANSSRYIKDAFQLLIPVLQVGAV